jgi:integrase
MVGGLKTEAGKNRQIPISEKIVSLLDTSGEYLITWEGKKLNYSLANDKLSEYMQSLGMDHYFHDTRHTTATLLEKADVPLLHRKLILGHSTSDVTDLYTHVEIERLIEDINLI